MFVNMYMNMYMYMYVHVQYEFVSKHTLRKENVRTVGLIFEILLLQGRRRGSCRSTAKESKRATMEGIRAHLFHWEYDHCKCILKWPNKHLDLRFTNPSNLYYTISTYQLSVSV